MSYIARPCPCGHPTCKRWVVGFAELRLSEEAAKAVAELLNKLEAEKPDSTY